MLGSRIPFELLYWEMALAMSVGVSTNLPPATLGGYTFVLSQGTGWKEKYGSSDR